MKKPMATPYYRASHIRTIVVLSYLVGVGTTLFVVLPFVALTGGW